MLSNYGLIGIVQLIINFVKTKVFYPKARLIRFPFRVRGKQHISFGKGLTTGVDCRIDAFPKATPKCLFIGNDVQINDSVHIGAVNSVVIGNRVLIASKVFITDHNHGFYGQDGVHSSPLIPPAKRQISSSPVKIEDDVWIGEFVSILPGVSIGKGSIIGTMSVVTKDIPPYSIAVGTPAKVIKQYDFQQNKWVKI